MADTRVIPWPGGSCPVAPDTIVTFFMGGGSTPKTRNAEDVRWLWVDGGRGGDVTGYYVGTPEGVA